MCRGYFVDNSPHIRAHLIRNLVMYETPLEFLIDTSSDRTMLGATGIVIMDIDVSHLTPTPITTVSRREDRAYVLSEPMMLVFIETDQNNITNWHLEFINEILIKPELTHNLLGLDVLNKFAVSYNQYTEEIDLKRNDFSVGQYMGIIE